MTPEQENAAHEMMMSPTLERLFQLSQSMQLDMTKPDDLKTALATCGHEVIRALDNNKIHFDDMESKAMFYGLLTATTDYVMDGNLKSSFKRASVN